MDPRGVPMLQNRNTIRLYYDFSVLGRVRDSIRNEMKLIDIGAVNYAGTTRHAGKYSRLVSELQRAFS